MSAYSVPKAILDMKPENTTVKVVKGHYYVYNSSSTSVKVQRADGTFQWKTKTTSGPCIGKITLEDGFIPNNNHLSQSEITVFEYGPYAFIRKVSSDILKKLKSFFNADDANQIFVCACITVVEGFTYMKNMREVFEQSVLSIWFKEVHVGQDAMRTLYENLGLRTTIPDQFEQSLIDESSKKVAIDGHVIACSSMMNDLSAFGYKVRQLGTPQINLMDVYDIETKQPLCTEMFGGANPDRSSMQVLFSRFLFENTMFVVDRGFNSATDKLLMSMNGNTYIVPMISGRTDYQSIYHKLKFDKRRYFLYDKSSHASLIYYKEYEGEGVRYIAYLDTTRQFAERNSYIRKMKEGKKGYTEEGLAECEKDFGLFLLETTTSLTPQEVFSTYKQRWEIETFYDYIDNSIDFNALYQQDYCRVQGLCFIIHIAGMIYHTLQMSAAEHSVSVKDIIRVMRGVKMVKERGKYVLRNVDKTRRAMGERLNLDLLNVSKSFSPT